MIKIENVEVYGWEAAIRGMRNPHNSWDQIDSHLVYIEDYETREIERLEFFAGVRDLKRMRSLALGGTDHGKFLRMINVTCDITCNQVWWAEFDTYKVGTVRNSCSKMHKIHVKPFDIDDFSHEGCGSVSYARDALERVISICECLRMDFNKTQDRKYWRALIELLPEGYNLRATVQMNYQVLQNMYHARRNHPMFEWDEFRKWAETLPYFKEICITEE